MTGCARCGPAHRITDPERHEAWHALVVEQGGPEGEVSTVALMRSRGLEPAVIGDPLLMPTADELKARRDRVTRKRWR